jgi:YD repeat-containing protein
VTDPLAGLTRFTYDPSGNLLTVEDARTQTTSYTYDNADVSVRSAHRGVADGRLVASASG